MTGALDRGDAYRLLREGTALADVAAHEVLWVEGPDAVSFLQGLVSQDVEAMTPGTVARSFLLGPQGKLVALLWLLRGEDRIGIVTDPGLGSTVAETLDRYRIRVRVRIAEDPRPRFEVWGRDVAAEGWSDVEGLVAALPLRGLGRVLHTGEPPADLPVVPGEVAEAVRVEEGEPIMGRDVDERTIPQETGLVTAAVSFTKGCYLGQELVARIDSRGHVNRHLRGIVVDGQEVPPAGVELVAGERTVGRLTSPVFSPGLGAPVGLALVRREVEPGARVTLRHRGSEIGASVRALPIR